MSTYLVNSQDLTSIANAIRTKGDTQVPLTFPSGFITAIGNISAGMDTSLLDNNGTRTDFTQVFKDCTALESIPGLDLRQATILSKMFMGCTSLIWRSGDPKIPTGTVQNVSSMFSGCTSLVNAKMFVTTGQPTITNANSLFYGCSNLEQVIMPNLHNATDVGSMFYACRKLRSIYGVLDFGSYNGTNRAIFGYCEKLVTVSFSENCIHIPELSFAYTQYLSESSLVSIANGLEVTSGTSRILRLYPADQSRLQSIKGTVNSSGTFTVSEQGSISLESFILNDKGWSIAYGV